MKKTIILLAVSMFFITGNAQHILPGNGNINLENLDKHIDTHMDISRLTVSELRVLRNAFAARQGYPFMSAELRSVFGTTMWYDSVFYKRSDIIDSTPEPYNGPRDTTDSRRDYLLMDEYIMPLKYTKDELAFIKKLKKREDELLKNNFNTAGGNTRANMDNVVNIYQMKNMEPRLREALGHSGFAIVPSKDEQMFHVYERNDYHDFPNFVTTDIYLQLFHLYFDCMLRETENKHFYNITERLCKTMRTAMKELADGTRNKSVKDAAEYNAAYFAIAEALLTGNDTVAEAGRFTESANEEIAKAKAAENELSEFLGYDKVLFPYSLFRPRGHYTRNDSLGRYFRAMMWLQTVPFGTDKPQQMKRAAVMADVLYGNAEAARLYDRLSKPITFFIGTPDNITIGQLYEEMAKTGRQLDEIVDNRRLMKQITAAMDKLGERQTRIRPKFELSSHNKINLMPQRYMPDAEVFQEMVDYRNEPTKRDVPNALDIPAAMGWSAAERILMEELGEKDRWEEFTPTLERMKKRMNEVDWDAAMATKWLKTLTTLGDTTSQMPYFMLTPQWQKKSLNTALASWAELKHDAILYAKQPMGAECGGAGPPSPVLKSYVEPNIGFWEKAIDLLDATRNIITGHDLMTDKFETATVSLREMAEFLLKASEKELSGKTLSNEEYDQIEHIGSQIEYISLDLLRENDEWLSSWDDVQGTDRNIALIADVYTANAFNNPIDKRSVLYGGVGTADEIYVVVEIGGYLYLTRGAVFSFREMKRPLDEPRMTDEEWQKMLKEAPRKGQPTWMNEIIVPMKETPQDREGVFYSSGC